MNKAKRISAALLAALLAAGLTMPAYAESASLTKEENVYVVLNNDGSIKSKTVSDHLYSASGLAGVTDHSSLTGIENTQSDATFTQNGDAIVWNTDDTDVYYKGTTDKDPPVTAAITYTLDGKAVSAAELAGKSGHLTMTVALTNHETGTVETNGATRQVCTPFVSLVTAILNDTFTNVSAKHGVLQGEGNSQVAAFACLPGVNACLSDLLPSQVDGLTDYLLDSVTLEADVKNYEQPSVMIACATDTSVLADAGDVLGTDDLSDLQDKLDELTDAMNKLIDGATKLDNGAADLSKGVGDLKNGTSTLKNGTSTLQNGTSTLKSGSAKLVSGATELKNGADKAAAGAATLKDGAASLNSGAAELKNGADKVASGANSLNSGLQTLTSKNDTLNSGAQQIADAVLKTANDTLKTAGAIDTDLTWSNYADVLAAAIGVNDAMRATARQQIAAQVQAKTGAALTDDQLSALIYLAAVEMGSDSSKDATTAITDAGAKLASAQTAATGVIAGAQNALTAAGNDPTQVPAVKSALEQAAVSAALAKVKAADSTLTDDQAKVALLLGAQMVQAGKAADLEAGVALVQQQLAAAKDAITAAGAAQTALTAATGDARNVDAVKSLLESTAANGALAKIKKADSSLTDDQAKVALLLAAQQVTAGNAADLKAGVETVQQQAAAAKDAVAAATKAQTALAAAQNNPVAVPEVAALLQAVANGNTDPAQTYATLAGKVSGGDDATNALIITMAAQSGDAATVAKNLDTALGSAADAAKTAKALNDANTALTAAAGNVAAVPDVKTVLDNGYTADAYTQISDGLKAKDATLDDATVALLVTMAAQAIAAGTQTDLNAALAAAGTAAAAVKPLNEANSAATAALKTANGNLLAVPGMQALIDSGYLKTAYATAVAGARAVKADLSDADAALLVTAAAQAVAAGSQPDLATAMNALAPTLTNAATVQNALSLVSSGDASAKALITSFLTRMVSTASSDKINQMIALNTQLGQVQGFVQGLKQYTAGVATAAAGASTLASGANDLDAGAGKLASGADKLDSGAGTLKEGTAQLASGAGTLLAGLNTLDAGASELSSGADKLNSGAAALDSGADKLQSGTATLKNGTAELKNGVNKLNDEGIAKITDSLDADQLTELKDVLSAMKDRQDGYTSFTGAPDGADVSVRFILKTAEATKTDTNESATTATTAKTSLWDRILALFGLGKKKN